LQGEKERKSTGNQEVVTEQVKKRKRKIMQIKVGNRSTAPYSALQKERTKSQVAPGSPGDHRLAALATG
jgi:hypothetical protein